MDDLRKGGDLSGNFKINRMVPQGKYHYFFSYMDDCFLDDNSQKVSIVPTQVSVYTNLIPNKIIEKLNRIEPRFPINIKELKLEYLNIIDTIPIAQSIALAEIEAKLEAEHEAQEERRLKKKMTLTTENLLA